MGDSPLDVHTKIIKEQSEFGFSQSFEGGSPSTVGCSLFSLFLLFLDT